MLILVDIPKFYILNDTLLKEKIQFQLRNNNGIPYEMKIRECFVHVDFLVLDMDVVDANLGQHTNALDRAVRERARCSSLCVERSDRSKGPVRPIAGDNRRRPTNANPGGTPSG
jgi:hypothetical protein